ncbi:hypothetical protein P9112_008139 [Eukaryota sp. TZLM1-RC]
MVTNSKRTSTTSGAPATKQTRHETEHEAESAERVSKLELRRRHLREKEHGDLIIDLNSKFVELTKKETTSDRRTELVLELHSSLESKYLGVIRNKRGSRLVQSVIRFGNDDIHSTIIKEISADIQNIACSPYTRRVITRLLTHCSATLISTLIEQLISLASTLARHVDGARVLEDLYTSSHASSSVKNSLILNVFGKTLTSICQLEQISLDSSVSDVLALRPVQKQSLVTSLIETINSLSSKGLIGLSFIQVAFYEVLKETDYKTVRNSVSGLLVEHLDYLISSKIGSKILVLAIICGTAKDRRGYLKAIKNHVVELCSNQYGYLVILALLASTDDTSALSKVIISEVVDSVSDLISDKFGHLIICFIINGFGSKQINADLKKMVSAVDIDGESSSKKDADVRRNELFNAIKDPLMTYITENLAEVLVDSNGQYVLIEFVSNFDQSSQFWQSFDEFIDVYKILSDISLRRSLRRLINRTDDACLELVVKKVLAFVDFDGLDSREVCVFCQYLHDLLVKRNLDELLPKFKQYLIDNSIDFSS